MNEIAYVIPGTGMDDSVIDRRQTIANELVDSEVVVSKTDRGPNAVESGVEHDLAIPGILRSIHSIAGDTDAIVIGCFSDPGLDAARELIDQPVIGPGHTAIHTAANLADSFSCLTIRDSPNPLERLVHDSHLDSKLASCRTLDLTVSEIIDSTDSAIEAVVSESNRAISEDGADAIVPGCMSLAFQQVHREIADVIGVPVIDPLSICLETAHSLARHGMTHSRASYPPLDGSQTSYFTGE